MSTFMGTQPRMLSYAGARDERFHIFSIEPPVHEAVARGSIPYFEGSYDRHSVTTYPNRTEVMFDVVDPNNVWSGAQFMANQIVGCTVDVESFDAFRPNPVVDAYLAETREQ